MVITDEDARPTAAPAITITLALGLIAAAFLLREAWAGLGPWIRLRRGMRRYRRGLPATEWVEDRSGQWQRVDNWDQTHVLAVWAEEVRRAPIPAVRRRHRQRAATPPRLPTIFEERRAPEGSEDESLQRQ